MLAGAATTPPAAAALPARAFLAPPPVSDSSPDDESSSPSSSDSILPDIMRRNCEYAISSKGIKERQAERDEGRHRSICYVDKP